MKILCGFILYSLFLFTATNCVAYNDAPFFIPEYETKPKYEKLPPLRKTNTRNTKPANQEEDVVYKVKYVLVEGVYVPTYTKVKKTKPAKEPEKIYAQINDNPVITDTPQEIEEPTSSIEETLVIPKNQTKQNKPKTYKKITDNQTKPKKTKKAAQTKTDDEPNYDETKTTLAQTKTDDEPNYDETEDIENNIKKVRHKPKNIPLPADDTILEGVPAYRNIYAQYLKDTVYFQKHGMFPKNKLLSESLQKMSSDKKSVIYQGRVSPILKN